MSSISNSLSIQTSQSTMPETAGNASFFDRIKKVGDVIYQKILSFCELDTDMVITCRAAQISDANKAKQFEEHLIHQPVVTLADIRQWEQLKGRTLASFDPEDPHIGFTKKIHHLDLGGADPTAETINDAEAHIILERFSNLKSLDASYTSIGNQTVTYLAHNFPGLERLSFTSCVNITSSALLQTLVRKHQELRVVGLSGIPAVNDTVLILLARNNPKLETLDVANTSITDDGVIALKRLKETLTYLNISGNDGVTNLGVGFAMRDLSKLQFLGIRDLIDLSEDSLFYDVHRSTCRDLSELDCSMDHLTDDVICEIAAKFSLKEYTLNQNLVSAESLYYVLENSVHLEKLNLKRYVINEAMIDLIAELPLLKSLDLSHNEMTYEQLNTLLLTAPSLEEVTIGDTFPQEELQTNFPHIHFRFVDETPIFQEMFLPLPHAVEEMNALEDVVEEVD